MAAKGDMGCEIVGDICSTGIMGDTILVIKSVTIPKWRSSSHKMLQATMQDILLVDFMETVQCTVIVFSEIYAEFSCG